MPPVNLLIKPASSLCNMRCRYCFYEDESVHRMCKSMGVMSEETACRVIDAAFNAAEGRYPIGFSFQGGEPTLAGLAFFKRFAEMVNERNTQHQRVYYAMQTNALTIDADWAAFLRQNHFLVGVSIDGDRTLHDTNRVDASGKGTYTRVSENLRLLQKNDVEVNALCVVTRSCARRPAQVYRALKALNMQYLQFIPCLDPLGETRGKMSYSLTPGLYGQFLCALFDEWYRDWESGQYVSVRQFDDYVHLSMGMPPSTCASSGRCGDYLVVEGDGSAYPCDFYVLDEWRLGELGEQSFAELRACERAQRFLQESAVRPKECASCRWQRLCFGGCKRDWEGTGVKAHNAFCSAYQAFFAYAGERIQRVAAAERMARLSL